MYDSGEQFGGELDKALDFVTYEALSRKKLTALSETRERRGKDDWWSTVLMPGLSNYPVGYVLTWRHSNRPKYSYTWNLNKPFQDDFMNFYKSLRTLFLKEVRKANVYKRK